MVITRELIRVLKRMLAKEVMLELLTYEPFGKFLPREEEYICEILSGNDNPPRPWRNSMNYFQASMTTMFSVRSSRML